MNIKKFLINKESSIRMALEQINNNAKNFLVIVDDGSLFLGLITEGDIRRSILSGISIDEQVLKIANKDAITIEENHYELDKIQQIFETMQVNILPVISNGHIKDILFKKDIKKTILSKTLVVVMAGGFGTRMSPLTDECPKPMLTIDNKPILEIILLKLKKQGFSNFIISLHHMPEKIKSYFKDGKDMGINIDYVYEEEPLGTAGSLSLVNPENYECILISNADVLTNLNFEKFLDFHIKKNSTMSIAAREYSYKIPFGVIDYEDNNVLSIREKPTITNFHSAGIYALNPHILKTITRNKYLDMPDLIEKLITQNEEVNMFPFFDLWIDLGRPEDFHQAKKNYKFSLDE